MPSISIPTVVGIAGAGASVVGAGMQAGAARDAASQQQAAAAQGQANQMAMFREIQNNLSPWLGAGVNANANLTNLLQSGIGGDPLKSYFGTPRDNHFAPTMEALENTPGYKFSLNQGLKATQNGFAARGLGSSGAALRGGADYAQGLASTTYQQAFGNYQTEYTQNANARNSLFQMLQSQSQLGQNSGVQTGNMGQNAVTQGNAALFGGAAAGAAGTIGAANAWGGAINGGSGLASNYLMYNALYGNGNNASAGSGSGAGANGIIGLGGWE